MTTVLELVYKYRQLVGAMASGRGLEFDEIEAVTTIESLFCAENAALPHVDRPVLGMDRVSLLAALRGKRACDEVEITELGPERLVITDAPFVDEGEILELVIEDSELAVSYRFMAQVLWTEDYGDSLEVELQFVGTPLMLRYGETSTRPATNPNLRAIGEAKTAPMPAVVAA